MHVYSSFTHMGMWPKGAGSSPCYVAEMKACASDEMTQVGKISSIEMTLETTLKLQTSAGLIHAGIAVLIVYGACMRFAN